MKRFKLYANEVLHEFREKWNTTKTKKNPHRDKKKHDPKAVLCRYRNICYETMDSRISSVLVISLSKDFSSNCFLPSVIPASL